MGLLPVRTMRCNRYVCKQYFFAVGCAFFFFFLNLVDEFPSSLNICKADFIDRHLLCLHPCLLENFPELSGVSLGARLVI